MKERIFSENKRIRGALQNKENAHQDYVRDWLQKWLWPLHQCKRRTKQDIKCIDGGRTEKKIREMEQYHRNNHAGGTELEDVPVCKTFSMYRPGCKTCTYTPCKISPWISTIVICKRSMNPDALLDNSSRHPLKILHNLPHVPNSWSLKVKSHNKFGYP